jgi:hypothetical protein
MIIIEFNKENQIPTTVIGRMRKSLDAIKKITREEKKNKKLDENKCFRFF